MPTRIWRSRLSSTETHNDTGGIKPAGTDKEANTMPCSGLTFGAADGTNLLARTLDFDQNPGV